MNKKTKIIIAGICIIALLAVGAAVAMFVMLMNKEDDTPQNNGVYTMDEGNYQQIMDDMGEQGSAYELVKDSCTYGLYKEAAVSFSADGVITLTNFNGANYASLSINDGTDDYTLNDADPADGEWVWDSDDSSSVKTFTLGSNWTSYILGKTITVTVNLQNGTTMESTPVAVPTN